MDTSSFQTFLAWLKVQNPIELGLIIGAVVMVFLLVMVLRRMRATGDASETARLSAVIAERDQQLREALSRADRAETLATERKTENDKLLSGIDMLRAKIDTDQGQLRDLASQIAGHSEKQKANVALISERDAAIKRLTDDVAALRARVEAEQRDQQGLKAQISSLETQLKAERDVAEGKIALLSRIRDDMQERFRQLADEALKTQGEAFSKANVEKLEATLTPLKEHVGHFEKELREVHQETVKDRERLKSEISQLTKRSEAISQEALALTRALKGDHQQQGAWGEMILESILERSGLRQGEEYVTQAHRTGTDGERLRPDVVVMIPGGKTLVIDSKVSLNDYAAAVNAEDDGVAMVSRKRHVMAMRAHINGLSAKSYQQAEGQSVDYVIMFVPIEGALSEALREDGTLTEYALERHITIATPTTLMMAMRTVSHVWAVERRNQNAENIAKRAGLLYDKVANFITSMEKVGKGIETAHGAYESALGQLSRGRGNVLSQVEALKSLGAKATKSISLEFEGKAEALALSVDLETAETAPAE